MSDPLNPYPGNLRRLVVDDSDLDLLILRTNDLDGLKHVRDTYEAMRAKDAELIQQLVDALEPVHSGYPDYMDVQDALEAAAVAGFKPSEP